jgi:hypothetical protein
MAEVIAEIDRWPTSAPSAVIATPVAVELVPTKRLPKLAVGLGLAAVASAAALIMAAVHHEPTPVVAPAPAPIVTPFVTPLPQPEPAPAPASPPAPVEAVEAATPPAPIKKHSTHPPATTAAVAKPAKPHHDDGVIVDPYKESP